MRGRLILALVGAVLLIAATSQATLSDPHGGGGGTTACQPSADLTAGHTTYGVGVNGELALYCAGVVAGGTDGSATPGTNTSSTMANRTPGQPCGISIAYETVALHNSPTPGFGQYTPGYVYPVTFWTGTAGATFPAGGGLISAQDVGRGMASGSMIATTLIGSDVVWASLATTGTGTWGADGLCHGPGAISIVLHVVTDTAPPGPIARTPPRMVPPTEQQALAQLEARAGTVNTDAPVDYVVFAPDCFWISPQPQGSASIPPTIATVVGPADANGISIVYSFYLQVAPSDTITWYFGDGTSAGSSASGSGPGACVPSSESGHMGHEYRQVDGTTPAQDGTPENVANSCATPDTTPGVPPTGASVVACQDVVVIAFMGWVDTGGAAHYECVEPGGQLAGSYAAQSQAIAACTTTYPAALQRGPLTKPVYQIRPIPVA